MLYFITISYFSQVSEVSCHYSSIFCIIIHKSNSYVTILDKLSKAVETNAKYKVEDALNKNLLAEDARKYETGLLNLLQKDKDLKSHFFAETDGGLVFKKDVFLQFISNKEFLPDSYTRYANKIGLGSDDGSLLSGSKDVVLNWPYKDAVLEGGQDKEDQKRSEVFFNEILAPDQITRLLDDKVFTNWKRYDKDGEHDLDELKDDDNLIIKGNNLVVLHSLKKRYAGKVKLIYIDPPYNTGGDDNIFSYNNTFNHSTWLTFMRNRLEIAKCLISNDGFITIAIDHAELFYLGALADEVFGRENRLSVITVQHNPKGRNQSKFFSENSEFLFVYAKDRNQANFYQVAIDEDVKASFTEQDGISKYRWEPYIRARTVWSREARPENWYPIYVSKDLSTISSDYIENGYELYPRTNTGDFSWKNIKKTFDDLNKNGYFKVVKDEKENVVLLHKYREQQVLKNVWTDKKYQSEFNGTNLLKKLIGKNEFSYPKSLYAVMDIVKIMSGDGDTVMDFFGGSGTTAHAILAADEEQKTRRTFIMCEQLDEHVDIMLRRIPRVIESRNFVYANIMNNANKFRKRVELAKDDKEYLALLKEATSSSFLSYRVDPTKLNEDEFRKLSSSDKRRLLLELIDNNTLYVNYEDINDPSFKVSDTDKKFNKELYK